MRIISILVSIVAMTSISRAADPPRITIEVPSNPRTTLHEARVDVRVAGDRAVVRLRIGLVSDVERHELANFQLARISLTVPADARVVGMELSQSDEAFIGSSMSAITARGEFDEHKNWYVDPALLEWHGMTPDHRRFLLSMSPITQTPSTVTILIVIPHLQRLELDVAGSRRTIPASAFARATAQDRAIAARAEFVTPDESLYAGPIDPPATHEGVQRYVRSDLVLCDDGDEAHDAVMHFTIANGHVHDFSIDGVPEPARGCVAEIADHWTFLEFENTIRVNYPLHFINLR